MRLSNLPREKGIKFRIKGCDPILTFHHLDGMYSYCKDERGNVVHIACFTEVELVESYD